MKNPGIDQLCLAGISCVVFEVVVLSKHKATSGASPESQLSADLSHRFNPPVSNFIHPTLSLLNLSSNLVFNRRIGDVELTMYVGFWGKFGLAVFHTDNAPNWHQSYTFLPSRYSIH